MASPQLTFTIAIKGNISSYSKPQPPYPRSISSNFSFLCTPQR
jgi:hypothetical protein